MERRDLLAASLDLQIDETSVSEGAGTGAITGTVTRVDASSTTAALNVALKFSDDNELSAPSIIRIPAEKTSQSFVIDTINDAELDGDAIVSITVEAVGFEPDAVTVTVTDDDTGDQKIIGGQFAGSLAKDSYLVSHTLTVPAGKTLTLEPGTAVLFSTDQNLNVRGTLDAQGTYSDPIFLGSAAAAPAPGDWAGLQFLNSSSQARSQVDLVGVWHAVYGVRVLRSEAPVTISRSDIGFHSRSGVYATDDLRTDDVIVRGNRIHDNAFHGIYVSGTGSGCNPGYTAITVSSNEVDHNGGSGIAMAARGSSGCLIGPGSGYVEARISGNEIHNNLNGITGYASPGGRSGHILGELNNNFIYDNLNDGIRLDSSEPDATNLEPKIVHNTIVRNGGHGIVHPGELNAELRIFNNLVANNLVGIAANTATEVPEGMVGYNDVLGNVNADWQNYPATFGDLTTTNRNGTPADIYQNLRIAARFLDDDLHLALDSPLIGAAMVDEDVIPAVTLDGDGDERAPTPDIGADEVHKLVLSFQPSSTSLDTTAVDRGYYQIREGAPDGAVKAVVRRTARDVSAKTTVTVVNPDAGNLMLPGSLDLQAGFRAATFDISIIDDGEIEADAESVLEVRAANTFPGRAGVRVIDDERLPAAAVGQQEVYLRRDARSATYRDAAVTWLSNGQYVVVWRSYDFENKAAKIVGQRYSINDQPLGGSFVIAALPSVSRWQIPHVAADAQGNFVVAWTEVNRNGVGDGSVSELDFAAYARRFQADGTPLTDPLTIGPTGGPGGQRLSSLTVAPDGGWAVVYSDQMSTAPQPTVQRYSANGDAVGAAEVLATSATDPDQGTAAVVADSEGNLIAAWSQLGSTERGVWAKRFDTNSGTWSPGFPIINTTTYQQARRPALAFADDGSFIALWTIKNSSYTSTVWGRRFTADGTAVTDAFEVGTQLRRDAPLVPRLLSVAANAAGDFTVAWESSDRASFTADRDITIRQFHRGGLPRGPEEMLNTSDGYQRAPQLAISPDHNQFVTVWNGKGPGDDDGILARRSVFPVPQLSASVAVSRVEESDGTSTGTVSRSGVNTSGAVTVLLDSNDTSEATVPSSVTIPAGQSSVDFDIELVDDDVPDGAQTVSITASASFHRDGSASFIVTDDDQALSLEIPVSEISESAGDGAIEAVVHRNNAPAEALVVVFQSDNADTPLPDDASKIQLPESVTIPGGQSSVQFSIDVLDNAVFDGTESVLIIATASGYAGDSHLLRVIDDELSLIIDASSISEADAAGAAMATVSRNTDTTASLTVSVTNDDPSEVSVPAAIVIPAGAGSTTFPIDAVDDGFVDGTQTVEITISAASHGPASQTIQVMDDDEPALSLKLATTSILEVDGTNATVATVTRNTEPETDLTIHLTSHDLTEILVPTSVTIPAGETAAQFSIHAVDDTLLDGVQNVRISATATNHKPADVHVEVQDDEIPALSLTIHAASVIETDGVSATRATIVRNSSFANSLEVRLTSSDDSKVQVPETVTIPAGRNWARFDVSAIDDAIADGTQVISINAVADEHAEAIGSLSVVDDDLPALSLTIDPPSFSEAAGPAAASLTIHRNTDPTEPLVVSLTSDDTSEATVPTTTSIPAGQASVEVLIDAVDDQIVDGNQIVRFTASADDHAAAKQMLEVRDDDLPALSLTIDPPSFSEAAGPAAASLTIHRDTDATNPLIVSLTSDDTSEANVPTTATIPAGQASVEVPVDAVDDRRIDGEQRVRITVRATGYTDGDISFDVVDNDSADIVVTSASELLTSEAGETATFSVALATLPEAKVTIELATDDPTEGSIEPPILTFNPENGTQPQTVSVVGIDDQELDGDQHFTIRFSPADSSDLNYHGLQPNSLQAINRDDEVALLDFGDLPDPTYATRLASDGPRHTVGSLRLGRTVDAEADAKTAPDAIGDSDDGISPVAGMIASNREPTVASFLVHASASGWLDAWIDFNGNGAFEHPAEHLGNGQSIAVSPGNQLLPFTIPAGAVPGERGARFRLSTEGGLQPTGPASDGEVEDYIFPLNSGDDTQSVTVHLPSQQTIVLLDDQHVVIRQDGSQLFRAPADTPGQINIIGTDGDDVLSLDGLLSPLSAGDISIDLAAGNDTLALAGSEQTLDFTSLEVGNLAGIEVIDITGQGGNVFTASLASIAAHFTHEEPLRIIAGEDDQLDLGDGWQVAKPTFIDGRHTHVMRSGTTRLHVQNSRLLQNPYIPGDVDRDGQVLPLDALFVINQLNRIGSGPFEMPTSESEIGATYFDVDGNRSLEPLDALRVINILNRKLRSNGEGEQPLVPANLPSGLVHAKQQPGGERQRAAPERFLDSSHSVGFIPSEHVTSSEKFDVIDQVVLRFTQKSETSSDRMVDETSLQLLADAIDNLNR